LPDKNKKDSEKDEETEKIDKRELFIHDISLEAGHPDAEKEIEKILKKIYMERTRD
jgi:hypothetical protein